MASFIELENSPMFYNEVYSIEQTSDELKDRCQRLCKGSMKYMAALSEACEGDSTFADFLGSFGGGKDDPLSLSLGGPIISKFVTTFRELATHKELLRSQVEHVLVDRLMQFMSVDLQGAKDSRQLFDKSMHAYDQARDKFVSLKKGTREDILAGLEEELHNSRSAFEASRFNLVNALSNVEAKMKYEFLESFSSIMDAHLRYFKLGYDLLKQMEPFIHQVLTCAHQYKEKANAEQDNLARRIQTFRAQAEMGNLQGSSNTMSAPNVVGIHPLGGETYRDIKTVMQSGVNNEQVHIIKQGYLHKRSSSLRGGWKRRFFVLDNRGTLYYYRTKGSKPADAKSYQSTASTEHSNLVFGRFRTKHSRTYSWTEESLGCCNVDLRSATIKMEADDIDLRLCFRIISPLKSYTLQAECEADRADWVDKITGVITSLLNSHLSEQVSDLLPNDKDDKNFPSDAGSNVQSGHRRTKSGNDVENRTGGVSKVLREIPGNDQCAECGSTEPDWASLNLGVLFCIQCSGAHRNLGVHISKVRSITLDVKVWEPTILDLFRVLGNDFCNSVWEERLSLENDGDETDIEPGLKPCPEDSYHKKEKYIHQKYIEKQFVCKRVAELGYSPTKAIWEAVRASDLRRLYRLIVVSDVTILNTTFDEVVTPGSSNDSSDQSQNSECKTLDPATCPYLRGSPHEPEKCLRGCSILHLACHMGDFFTVELLLQFGSDVNMRDFHGRTPLHHCITKRNNELAKYLLRRGAHQLIKDWGGLTALERAMKSGAITDEELFILLSENQY